MSNYVISIGGSGSRSVEALVHMCAAGLGPKDLNIIFVDPDKSNGNLTKAQEVLVEYMNTRKMLVDNGIKLGEGDFYYTDFGNTTENHWGIFTKDNNTLEKFINFSTLSEIEKDFIKTLYSTDELQTQLDEGFRGHPSIGALVMSLVDFEQEPWKSFWNSVISLSTERSTKVFIFGSIFGGTGAAGLPTIAKIIKGHKDIGLADGKSKVDLGGTLLLPYFTFELPKQGTKGLFVTVNDFPLAAKAALKFYGSEDTGFDDIYLLGEITENSLGEFSTGTQSQKNKSHYVELLAAFSSLDFFHTLKPPTDTKKRVFLSARNDNDQIRWEEIPYSREANTRFHHQKVFGSVEEFTTFLYVKEKFFNDVVLEELKKSTNYRAPWYKNTFDTEINLTKDNGIHPKVSEALRQLIKYRNLYQRWVSEISENKGKVSVRLFNVMEQKEHWDKDTVGRLLTDRRTKKKIHFLDDMTTISDQKEFQNQVKSVKEPFFRLYSLTKQSTHKFLG
ncbi:MAG: hypothetical protein HBSAPP04_00230 [Ignavibacteriaceae bacterium]|nr:MAG: hypothetical protein HBSAPP04_00230 [Ignavibacteriaceae bacterium]